MNRIDTPIRELSDDELDARLADHFSAPARYRAGVSMIPSLAHDEASWARASRSVGPVVTPCKPLPLLTRWAMRVSAWFNRKT